MTISIITEDMAATTAIVALTTTVSVMTDISTGDVSTTGDGGTVVTVSTTGAIGTTAEETAGGTDTFSVTTLHTRLTICKDCWPFFLLSLGLLLKGGR